MAKRTGIKRSSTDTDMTPFVDIAFLILSFFIMATKFKPEEPVKVTTPNSVNSQEMPENDAALVTIDKEGKVYFSLLSEKDPSKFTDVIEGINRARNLNLTPAEIANYKTTPLVGVPFNQLKSLLNMSAEDFKNVNQPGIPTLDSTNNQLTDWIGATKIAFAGSKLTWLIKGDNNAKYPAFKSVIDAFKKNNEMKYSLIATPSAIPSGTDLYIQKAHEK